MQVHPSGDVALFPGHWAGSKVSGIGCSLCPPTSPDHARLGVEHIPYNLTLESVNVALAFDLALYLQMHSFLQKKRKSWFVGA